jgi:FemAB-related protein (PEP-CTERM system-associated)
VNINQIGVGEDEDRWDAYVGPRTTTVTDLSAWRRVVRDAYGSRSTFLTATEGDRLVGALGLFEVRHPLFGHYLATAAFGNDGGLHFDDETARDALLAEARAVADRLDVEYLLIRTRGAPLDGFSVDRHYRTAVIDLAGGAEEVWKNILPAKTRNQIRRGMKEGFSVETGHEQIRPFYDVFHEHMRDLGSPAHRMRFYESAVRHLGDRAEFFVVKDGGALAAGALVFWTNGTAMNYHTVALRKYNSRCPNYLIYWKMIEASCAHGCARFDMGRSEMDSPTLKFKMNWGPEPLPLFYNYYLRKLKEIPYVDPRNPRYRIPIAIWKRLPVFATKSLGPLLMAGLI